MDEDKARVVAETLQPGAVVAEVARRWQVCSQQVFTWRRELRRAVAAAPGFVPIVSEPLAAVSERPPTSSLELELAGVILRMPPGTDADLLAAV